MVVQLHFADVRQGIRNGVQYPVRYAVHPHHRNNNPQKAQWNITVAQEIGVFGSSFDSGWLISEVGQGKQQVGWGLFIHQNRVKCVGKLIDRSKMATYAKFLGINDEWHGFPADYNRNFDKPTLAIHSSWLQHMGEAKVRKIIRGEPCKL